MTARPDPRLPDPASIDHCAEATERIEGFAEAVISLMRGPLAPSAARAQRLLTKEELSCFQSVRIEAYKKNLITLAANNYVRHALKFWDEQHLAIRMLVDVLIMELQQSLRLR